MFAQVASSWLALCCLSLTRSSFVLAQDNYLRFTSGVSSPAPQPGQPFTITWTGGDPAGTVYIILNYLFPDTPDQEIVYGQTDILSNAPNNGSWVYNVPGNLFPGRYEFSIGINPFLQSDSTPAFTIINPGATSIVPQPSPTTTASSFSYNGCGLIPLPDFTYTGYQAPCTYSTNGRVETVYPIVPASLSSSFYGSDGVIKTNTYLASLITPPGADSTSTSTSTSISAGDWNEVSSSTAVVSSAYARALQCPSSVIATPVSITAHGTTTVFTSIGCSTEVATSDTEGVCHTTGYTTFSVSGTRSVCCPAGWGTTPLASDMYCFTSVPERARLFTTGAVDVASVTSLTALAFTSAGVVRNDAAPAQTSPAKNASPQFKPGRTLLTLSVLLTGYLLV